MPATKRVGVVPDIQGLILDTICAGCAGWESDMPNMQRITSPIPVSFPHAKALIVLMGKLPMTNCLVVVGEVGDS